MSYPFRAVLFDMNGVVVDDAKIREQAWRTLTLSHGYHLVEDRLRHTNGRRAVDVVAEIFGKKTGSKHVIELAEEYEAMHCAYVLTEKPPIVSGVKNFLEDLGRLHVPRVLATSATIGSVGITLKRSGLIKLFDHIITANDVEQGKPEPEIYLKAAAKCGADITSCLVVEDAGAGIQAAKAAGASCLGITTSESADGLRRFGADWTAQDFCHLPDAVSIQRLAHRE